MNRVFFSLALASVLSFGTLAHAQPTAPAHSQMREMPEHMHHAPQAHASKGHGHKHAHKREMRERHLRHCVAKAKDRAQVQQCAKHHTRRAHHPRVR